MDKRNTEQDFISAFWQLYEKKPIEKISINQLCQIAGYNRATFYNHFENIYALFYFLLKEMYSHHKTFTTYCKKI